MHKLFSKIFLYCLLLCPIFVHSQSILTDNGVPVTIFRKTISENLGTVIVAHGCYGVSDHEERIAKLFSSEGFNSIVVDSWAYRGIPKGNGPGSMCQVYAVTGEQRLEETYKTVNWIKRQSWHSGKIFLIGFSHGGALALQASQNSLDKGIDKSVSFYPYCFPYDHREPKIPVQLHIGSSDDWTPPHRCRGIYSGWFRNYKNGEYYEYQNSTHAFDVQGLMFRCPQNGCVRRGIGEGGMVVDRVIKYNQETTTLAYERVLKFFKE